MDLRFTCLPNCSVCCQMEGEVYLSPDDLPRIAQHLGLDAPSFEKLYCIRTRSETRLRKPLDRQCQFHQDNKCSIHPVKPVQCRAFPFWPELLENQNAWEETSRYCPGMSAGELVNIEDAKSTAAEMKAAYPSMY